jgi:hypothetical protein
MAEVQHYCEHVLKLVYVVCMVWRNDRKAGVRSERILMNLRCCAPLQVDWGIIKLSRLNSLGTSRAMSRHRLALPERRSPGTAHRAQIGGPTSPLVLPLAYGEGMAEFKISASNT